MWFRGVIISPTCINFPTTATKREQHRQRNNCCNRACCFQGLYRILTGFAYSLIWQGVAWWIALAVNVSRATNGGKFTYITTRFLVHAYMYVYRPRPPSFKTGLGIKLTIIHVL